MNRTLVTLTISFEVEHKNQSNLDEKENTIISEIEDTIGKSGYYIDTIEVDSQEI